MALTCKNCGGNIILDSASNLMICDSCGTQQSMSTLLNLEYSNFIFDENSISERDLATYKKAIVAMRYAQTENSYNQAAVIFEEIPNFLNSQDLAKECREKANAFRTERLYSGALLDLQSDEPAKIEGAILRLKSLNGYKDSFKKIEEGTSRLAEAQENYQKKLKEAEIQKLAEEKQKRQAKAFKKFKTKLFLFSITTLIIIFAIGYFSAYSSSNIKISISPDTENFLIEKGNKYIFCYDVQIKNNGIFDVSEIDGSIIIEKDNVVLVDTNINFYNSSAVVRAKKKSNYNWELTVYSYDTALILYQTDFDDLDIIIDIESIEYTNGKTKKY